ncbi:hypothetical protein GCM10028824_41370 [Hymenobacter segetis]
MLGIRTAGGQVEYRRTGVWRTFYRSGRLMSLHDYGTLRTTYFQPDGRLVSDTYNDKEEAYPGDSLQRASEVLFAHGSRTDTLVVKHTEYRNNRFLRRFYSKDFAGNQRVAFPETPDKPRSKQRN